MSITAYASVNKRQSAVSTPQSQPIPGEQMVKNSGGGYSYQLDKWDAFTRFLILGTEGGTYSVSQAKLTTSNMTNVIDCINEDGPRAVNLIVDISHSGRAPKNDAAIFALALAASNPVDATRAYALAKLSDVCRIPTHLFHFVTFVKQFRGLGRGLRTALANWYQSLSVDKLAYEVVKYQQRDGWSNADVLRIAHPETADPVRSAVYRWMLGQDLGARTLKASGSKGSRKYGAVKAVLPDVIGAFEALKTETDPDVIATLVSDYNLSREMVPTASLNHAVVWEALLQKMPLTALIRNLGNMSKVGLLTPMSDASKLVVSKLADVDAIKKARIHPLSILVALKTYESGQGLKGSGTWTKVPAVVDALDDAFYLAFDAIIPTGKRMLYGIDVSGSMGWSNVGGMPITPAMAAAAMAMALVRSEQDYYVFGFADTFRDLGITKKMSLKQAMKQTDAQNFGSTNCALPMEWALKTKTKVDGFVVLTDSDTNTGRQHPSQALRKYREAMGIPSKQIVVGMTATNFTIADPKDPGALDVVGFDTGTPQMISEFVRL